MVLHDYYKPRSRRGKTLRDAIKCTQNVLLRKGVGRKRTENKDWSREVMLHRCDTEPITVKGDGRTKGSAEKEDEGYIANRQNHIRITIQRPARKQQNSTKKLIPSRHDGKRGTQARVIRRVKSGVLANSGS